MSGEASSVAPHHSHYRLSLPHQPSPLVCGQTVFHETGPWCQTSWGPLQDHKVPTVQRSANFSVKSQMANILGRAGYTVNATQLVKKQNKTKVFNADCGKHNLM